MSEPQSELQSEPKSEPRSEPGIHFSSLSLADLSDHCPALVSGVDTAAAGQPADRAGQLADIGFTAGETVTVLARAWPGGDPLVVRVGASRFALRRAEAACVQVRVHVHVQAQVEVQAHAQAQDRV